MQQLTLASVRQQVEDYRKTRKNRRHPFPEEILENIRQLCKTIPIGKLQQELKLSESTVRKFRKPRIKARAGRAFSNGAGSLLSKQNNIQYQLT